MKTKSLSIFLLLSGLFLSAGCVSSRYAVQTLPDALAYNEEVEAAYTADAEWWKQYGNAGLNRLVELALTNNPDVLKAAIAINKELYNLNLSRADLFPTLSAQAGATAKRKAFKSDNWANDFSGEIGLSYELDLYGRLRDAASAQAFEYQATVMDYESARLGLINSVVDLYFNLEYLENAIRLAQSNIQSSGQTLQIVQSKYTHGKVDRLEILQAEQSLLSEQKTLLELETQFKELEQSLRNILNLKPGDELELPTASLLEQKTLDVDVEVPLAVLANRPDLRAAQFRLEKAFKTLQAGDKNWYPTISISGALQSSSEKFRTTFDVPYTFGSVSISLPFLDWARVKNNLRISEADYQTARLDFSDALNQALNEVAYYYYAYRKACELLANAQEGFAHAARIADYYESKFNSGKSELKDYLDAAANRNAAEKTLIQQKYKVIQYENAVYQAMAGKYTPAAP